MPLPTQRYSGILHLGPSNLLVVATFKGFIMRTQLSESDFCHYIVLDPETMEDLCITM